MATQAAVAGEKKELSAEEQKAADLKAEVQDFDDTGASSLDTGEEQAPVRPEEKPAESAEQPAGQPAGEETEAQPSEKSATDGAVKEPTVSELLEKIDKLTGQVGNLNTALSQERHKRKELEKKTEKSPVAGEETTEIEIDPEVKKTLDAWAKKNGFLTHDEMMSTVNEQSRLAARETLFEADMGRVKGANADFDEVFNRFFLPEAQKDPALLAEFQQNLVNPAEFAYKKGKEIMAKLLPASKPSEDSVPKSQLDDMLKAAREEGRKEGMEQVAGQKVIGSFGSVPGGSPSHTSKKSELQQEVEDF
ncbi:MAG TPA: hypothetical protein VF790_11685 [Dissulfurispiraceae bacterium]